MRNIACGACVNTTYFENRNCINCGARLGFVTESQSLEALVPAHGTVRTLAADPYEHSFSRRWVGAGFECLPWPASQHGRTVTASFYPQPARPGKTQLRAPYHYTAGPDGRPRHGHTAQRLGVSQ